MFVPNPRKQMSIYDSIDDMPEYLKEYLLNSWAHTFNKYIFPEINEDRFSVLYSDKGSRPNSPVNVIIGALILKEVFNLNDEQLLGEIYFNELYQYALRLIEDEKPPVSINTFTNFRSRVYDYLEKTGTDLIQQEMESLADVIAEHLEIENKDVRVDSFMISSSCKNMSRLELIYTVNLQFIKLLSDKSEKSIPEECECYLQEGHKKDTIYRTKDSELETKLEHLLKHSKMLYNAGKNMDKEITESQEFQSLKRMLGEQTKDSNDDDNDNDNFDNIEPKKSENLDSDILQNPNDPDATFRFKYDGNIGYTANMVEIFDGNNAVLKHYDLEPNIYSDQNFCQDSIQKLDEDENIVANTENDTPSTNSVPDPDNEDFLSDLINVFVDGAYYTFELGMKALEKGINLIPGELTGKNPSSDKVSFSEFKVDENNYICECPEGHSPDFSYYHDDNQSYTARFPKEFCNNCSKKEICRVQEIKDSYSIRFSNKEYYYSKLRDKMKTKDYKKLTNKRAGIEGIPSVFRRKYNIDSMPVRGKVRSKIWLGFKTAAINVKRLFSKKQVCGV